MFEEGAATPADTEERIGRGKRGTARRLRPE